MKGFHTKGWLEIHAIFNCDSRNQYCLISIIISLLFLKWNCMAADPDNDVIDNTKTVSDCGRLSSFTLFSPCRQSNTVKLQELTPNEASLKITNKKLNQPSKIYYCDEGKWKFCTDEPGVCFSGVFSIFSLGKMIKSQLT